jgi:pimeloyl-ACP methyl ester carboxylesterase
VRRLASHGYVVVTFDKPGSGNSPYPNPAESSCSLVSSCSDPATSSCFGCAVTQQEMAGLHAQLIRQLHTGRFLVTGAADACPSGAPARAGFAQLILYGLSAGYNETLETIAQHLTDDSVKAAILVASQSVGTPATAKYLAEYALEQNIQFPRIAESQTVCQALFFDRAGADPLLMKIGCPDAGAPRAPFGILRSGGALRIRNHDMNIRKVLELGIPVLRVIGETDPFVPGPVFFEPPPRFTAPPALDLRAADADLWERACRGETCPGCASLEPCDATEYIQPQASHLSALHASMPDQVAAIVDWLASRGLGPAPGR